MKLVARIVQRVGRGFGKRKKMHVKCIEALEESLLAFFSCMLNIRADKQASLIHIELAH